MLALEESSDGGTTWQLVPFTTRDGGQLVQHDGTVAGSGHRTWWKAEANLAQADLAAGELLVRWRFTTYATNLGRGVLVDAVKVQARDNGTVLDGERHPEVFTATGWTAVQR